ncbi:TRAP transporter substrate-binding protein [Neobacillus niacini]|uniref:TRAP transporter substrate-binding protein n=1 Tax=Neobacillus niacini TaxID=86668 RepID=UPI002FFF82B1
MKNKLLIFMIVLGMVTLIGCSSSSSNGTTNKENETNKSSEGSVEEVSFKFAHGYPVEQHTHKGFEQLKELVSEKSGGKINLSIFPSGQLYNDIGVVDAISTGQIEAGATTFEMLTSLVPSAELIVLPVFDDYKHLHRALDNGVRKIFEDEFAKANLYPIIWGDFGMAYYASKETPLKTPNDFKGKRVRTTSPLMSKFVEAAGGTPITMPGAEVVQALQRGTIDAGLSAPVAFIAQQYYEVTEYYTGPQNAGISISLVNLDWWNSLSEETRNIILESSKEVEGWMSEEVQTQHEANAKTLSEKGMKFVEVDKKSFKAVEDKVLEGFYQTTGDIGKEIMEIINSSRD